MRTSFIALAVAATLSAGLAQAESATYSVDPTHTFATFEIGHFGASTNRGRFDKKTGSITLAKNTTAASGHEPDCHRNTTPLMMVSSWLPSSEVVTIIGSRLAGT